MMMTKRQVNITNLEELEQEERRVRQRIRRQEAELVGRVKRLPEEAVSAAFMKLIGAVLEGNMLRSVVNFAKKLGKNVLSRLFKDIL